MIQKIVSFTALEKNGQVIQKPMKEMDKKDPGQSYNKLLSFIFFVNQVYSKHFSISSTITFFPC